MWGTGFAPVFPVVGVLIGRTPRMLKRCIASRVAHWRCLPNRCSMDRCRLLRSRLGCRLGLLLDRRSGCRCRSTALDFRTEESVQPGAVLSCALSPASENEPPGIMSDRLVPVHPSALSFLIVQGAASSDRCKNKTSPVPVSSMPIALFIGSAGSTRDSTSNRTMMYGPLLPSLMVCSVKFTQYVSAG